MTNEDLKNAVSYLLVSRLNDLVSHNIGSTTNSDLVDAFFRQMSDHMPNVFFDIGANDGSIGLRVKEAFPSCHVLSFEANPFIYEQNRQKLQDAAIDSYNVAVNSSNGKVRLFIPKSLSKIYLDGEIVDGLTRESSTTGKSSILQRNENATYEEILIDCVTLDKVSSALENQMQGRNFALWIDVEGAAFDVLLGAESTLNRTSFVFVECELHEFWKDQKNVGDVAQHLLNRGFVPIGRDREYADKQFNTLFIHNSLLSRIITRSFSIDAPTKECFSGQLTAKVSTLAAMRLRDTPIYIPTFNNPTYLLQMLKQLSYQGLNNLIIYDNGSTYQPMIDLLDELHRKHKVVFSKNNIGPQKVVTDPSNFSEMPDIFCVTDPDLAFNRSLPDNFMETLVKATQLFKVGKAGFALDISDTASMKPEKFTIHARSYHIWEWEEQFWRNKVGQLSAGDAIYRSNIDTTFALYNKQFFDKESFYDAVRIAGRFTARHLPWYLDENISQEEKAFYQQTQKFSYHS